MLGVSDEADDFDRTTPRWGDLDLRFTFTIVVVLDLPTVRRDVGKPGPKLRASLLVLGSKLARDPPKLVLSVGFLRMRDRDVKLAASCGCRLTLSCSFAPALAMIEDAADDRRLPPDRLLALLLRLRLLLR
jgi:hypothetical protein